MTTCQNFIISFNIFSHISLNTTWQHTFVEYLTPLLKTGLHHFLTATWQPCSQSNRWCVWRWRQLATKDIIIYQRVLISGQFEVALLVSCRDYDEMAGLKVFYNGLTFLSNVKSCSILVIEFWFWRLWAAAAVCQDMCSLYRRRDFCLCYS